MAKRILVVTKNGRILKVGVDQIPAQTRDSMGVKLINVKEGDAVVAVSVVEE